MAGPLHGHTRQTQRLGNVFQGWGHPELWLRCLPVLSFPRPLRWTETSMWSCTDGLYPERGPRWPKSWCQWRLWFAGLWVNRALWRNGKQHEKHRRKNFIDFFFYYFIIPLWLLMIELRSLLKRTSFSQERVSSTCDWFLQRLEEWNQTGQNQRKPRLKSPAITHLSLLEPLRICLTSRIFSPHAQGPLEKSL